MLNVPLPERRAVELLPLALSLPPGATPFPWQVRLLNRLLRGDLPSAIDLPTGLGKTSVLPIWLLARAAGAPLPRRLVYVVDRRAVVDQASSVAETLAAFVSATPDLATALGIEATGGLVVSTLRGQHVDNRRWLDDPGAPAILVGTVDMIGSRLLFAGYGTSRKTRSLHAALLGIDSLLVLDEAHLSPTFEALVRAIPGTPFDGRRTDIVPPRVKLLPLSATQRTSSAAVFGLEDEDRSHPTLRDRLYANKWAAFHETLSDAAAHADRVATLTLERVRADVRRVVVYLDSREQVQEAKQAFVDLCKREGMDVDTELLVGARRVHERNEVFAWLTEHGFLGSGRTPRRGALFATSAGEVGIDLDADHLICDLVPFERLVQRLGRVNRRGHTDSLVDILPLKARKETTAGSRDEDDGDAAGTPTESPSVIALLTCLEARAEDGRRNLSPDALRQLQTTRPLEVLAASTPPPLHPALTRPLVEAWSMTSLCQHTARPTIEPWVRGWVDTDPQTAIVWRNHLPINADRQALPHQLVRAYFDAAPSTRTETLETETYLVTKWLAALKKKVDVAGASLTKAQGEAMAAETDKAGSALEPLPAPGDIVGFVVDGAGDVVFDGAISGYTLERLTTLKDRDLIGKTVFLDVRLGGLRHGLLWAAGQASEVAPSDGRPMRSALQPTTDPDPSGSWRRVFTAPVKTDADGRIEEYLTIDHRLDGDRPEEDGLSVSRAQALSEHQDWARAEALRIGVAVDLPPDDLAMLTAAAMHHDDGKASARWQAAFHAPRSEPPLAKVGKWIDQDLLAGYRHETGSLLALMGAWDVFPEANSAAALASLSPDRRELALHLVSSHHGLSRPTLSVVGVEAIPPSKLAPVQREVAERFAALQETWGPWGLAWWEALLRAADGLASRKNEQKEPTP